MKCEEVVRHFTGQKSLETTGTGLKTHIAAENE